MKKLIGIIAALAMITGSAYAADWNFYGSARVSTFVEDLDTTDNTSYDQGLQGNSRIGATVKVSDSLTGGFEYGTGVNVRKLYGEWDFGAGSLLVGQTYTPMNVFYSNQVYGGDNDMLGQGGIYSGRKAMLRLKFGGFQIAAVETQTSDFGNDGKVKPTTGVVNKKWTTEANLPGIEAAYRAKFDNVALFLTAGYNTFQVTDQNKKEYDVDTWIVGAGAKADFGPAYIAGNIYAGQNAGHMITVSVDGDNEGDDGMAEIDDATGKIYDNDVMGVLLVAGYKLNEMFNFEAGYAFAQTELDKDNAKEDEVQTYYIQSTITLAPGVYVIPEVGVIDGEEDGDETTTYYGAKWQINF